MPLGGGRSRVEYCSVAKSNLLFAKTAALKIDVQQEKNLWSELLWGVWAALTRAEKSAGRAHCV